MHVFVVKHPVVQDRLARLRSRETPSEDFRRAVHEMAMLIAFEATRGLQTVETEVATPVAKANARVLANPVVIVPILRAGLGMAHGILELLPEAKVGHIGLARNEVTHRPEGYYRNLPDNLGQAEVLLVDPMLATGHSASTAANLLVEAGARHVSLLTILAAPEGVEVFRAAHPGIPVFTAAIDDGLTAAAFITPGLGDAGDRYFGTGTVPPSTPVPAS